MDVGTLYATLLRQRTTVMNVPFYPLSVPNMLNERVAFDLTPDTRSFEIDLRQSGLHTSRYDDLLSNKLIDYQSPYGPITLLFDSAGMTKSIVFTMVGERFSQLVDRQTTKILSITVPELMLLGDNQEDYVLIYLYFDDKIAAQSMDERAEQYVESSEYICPFGSVNLILRSPGVVNTIEIV